VGLTYIGLATAPGTDVHRLQLAGDRAGNREAAARAALDWLIAEAERNG
jgi:nicotinamide mononucleotide (NMN) deamidase PncC